MSLRKIGFFILSFVVAFSSCKKDDDGGGDVVPIEIRDRGEQQISDNAMLLDYLETHYYNSDVFDASNTDPNIKDLVINALTDGETVAPNGNTLLIDAVENKPVVYAETDYIYYILRLNQGGGDKSPSFADDVQVIYEGFTLDGEVFDSKVNPDDDPFDLISLIPAWRKVLPQFNVAEGFNEPGDGTIDFLNHGTGVMFIPSGLAYFSNSTAGISAYEPIIFKFELYKTTENDHDGDGVPSYKEDLFMEDGTQGSDGEFTVNYDDLTDATDDDTDGDGTPDYADSDDDGDGVLTINEDLNDDGDPTNDIGANGIPNYLDPEETTSKE